MPTALVIHHAGMIGGGTASFLDVLHMLSGTFDVVAACPPVPADAEALVRAAGFPTLPLPIPTPAFHAYTGAPGLTSPQFWTGITRALSHTQDWIDLISSTQADVVLANSSVLMPLGPAIRRAGAKSICIIRETIPPNAHRSALLYRGLSRWFDGVVFISEFDRSQAGPFTGTAIVARDCVRNSFRRLDRTEACRQLGLQEESFNVLFTGGHSWFKGLDVALAAVDMARIEGLRLVIAGHRRKTELTLKERVTGANRGRSRLFDERVDHLMKRKYLRNCVDFVGIQQDMSACYSAADLVLFPATLPHQAKPLIEAAHYGLPVLCSDFPQYAEHAPVRYTFAAGDVPEMARTLVRIVGEYPAALGGAEVNRNHCATMNDFRTEGARLSQFLLELMGGH